MASFATFPSKFSFSPRDFLVSPFVTVRLVAQLVGLAVASSVALHISCESTVEGKVLLSKCGEARMCMSQSSEYQLASKLDGTSVTTSGLTLTSRL